MLNCISCLVNCYNVPITLCHMEKMFTIRTINKLLWLIFIIWESTFQINRVISLIRIFFLSIHSPPLFVPLSVFLVRLICLLFRFYGKFFLIFCKFWIKWFLQNKDWEEYWRCLFPKVYPRFFIIKVVEQPELMCGSSS